MPRVKLDYVVSFSSEDSDNPASNLLATEISKKKWLGAHKGEASNSVVLQLTKSAKVFSVHIGSYDSALVEVLVGRSEAPNESFKVLILNSIFMTPVESRKGEGMTKIRTFSYDQLQADTRDRCWDRIRVVCLQPYNKHCKYGLSFIHIFESDGLNQDRRTDTNAVATTTGSSFASFVIRTQSSDEDDDSSFKPGELFARLKQKNQLSTQSQIKNASSPQTIKGMNSTSLSSNLLVKTPIQSKVKCKRDNQDSSPNEVRNRLRDDIMYRDEEEPNKKIDKIMQRDKDEKSKSIVGEYMSSSSKKDDYIETSSIKNKDGGNDTKTDLKVKDKCKEERDRSEKGKDRKEKEKDRSEKEKDRSEKEKEKREKEKYRSEKQTERSEKQTERSEKDKERIGKETGRNEKDKRDPKNAASSNNCSRKRPSSNDTYGSVKKPKTDERAPTPHSLMRGVTFVMSGYENPRRGTLRDKALAMGAKYRSDWTQDCTHLICAFPDTPKLTQVRKSGDSATIVTGEWIEECSRKRKLLPWQWFATEPKLKKARDVLEDQSEKEHQTHQSEEDTDDEIERVRQQQQTQNKQRSASPEKQNKPVLSNITEPSESTIELETKTDIIETVDKTEIKDNGDINGNSSEIRDCDSDSTIIEEIVEPVPIVDVTEDSEEENTEVEEDNDENDGTSDSTVKDSLPDFFANRTFVIDEKIASEGFDVNLLKRYILAYDGDVVDNISDDSRIDYVLSLNEDCKLARKSKSVRIVRPDWVWSCNDRRKKVSVNDYLVK